MSLWVAIVVCVAAGVMGLHRMIWPDRWWKMSFRQHALEHPEADDVAEARARGRLHSGIMLAIAILPWVWRLTS
jgi:hypothetical protein